MKSWTNKVLFFSSNSIFFILLTRSNFFHIHTGNGLEEVLENQETGEEKKQRKRHKKTETNPRAEEKEIFSLLFFLLFFLMEMMMMMISTMMMGMTVGMMTMMIQHCWSSDAWIGKIIHYIYLFDISHSLFMKDCPYFDIYCAHCNWSLYIRGYECFY